MLKASAGSSGFSRPSARRSWRLIPRLSLAYGPRYRSTRVGSKRSKPAGTGVCVVKTFPTRVTVRATSKGFPLSSNVERPADAPAGIVVSQRERPRTGADATRHAGPATTSDRRRRVRGGNERWMQPAERRDRVASRRQAQRNDEDRGHHDQQQAQILLRTIAVQGAQARSDDQQDRHDGDDPWQRLSCSHTRFHLQDRYQRYDPCAARVILPAVGHGRAETFLPGLR